MSSFNEEDAGDADGHETEKLKLKVEILFSAEVCFYQERSKEMGE